MQEGAEGTVGNMLPRGMQMEKDWEPWHYQIGFGAEWFLKGSFELVADFATVSEK